jgi:hypothetical protein
MRRENYKGEEQRKGPSGRTFFSKFTAPEQSYAAVLRQEHHQATQAKGKSVRHPVQQYLVCQYRHNNTVAIVVQQVMTELSRSVSEEDRRRSSLQK